MNDVLETVDGCDLALTTPVNATNDGDFVVLSDWDGADLKLMSVMLGGFALWQKLTLYFSRSSLLRGALMIVRLTLDGAS